MVNGPIELDSYFRALNADEHIEAQYRGLVQSDSHFLEAYIDVGGKGGDVGTDLRKHVIDSFLNEVDKRGGSGSLSGAVVFSRISYEFNCNISLKVDHAVCQATGHASEIYAAFQSAYEKARKQLGKARSRAKRSRPNSKVGQRFRELSARPPLVVVEPGNPLEESQGVAQPIIVSTPLDDLPVISKAEAWRVARSKRGICVFRDADSGKVCLVYPDEEGAWKVLTL